MEASFHKISDSCFYSDSALTICNIDQVIGYLFSCWILIGQNTEISSD